MDLRLKTFCFVLSVLFILSFVGCNKGDTPSSTIDASINNSSSSDSQSADSNTSYGSDSYDTNSNYYDDLGSLKPMDPDFSQDESEQDVPSRYDPTYGDGHINNIEQSSSKNSSSTNNFNPEDYYHPENYPDSEYYPDLDDEFGSSSNSSSTDNLGSSNNQSSSNNSNSSNRPSFSSIPSSSGRPSYSSRPSSSSKPSSSIIISSSGRPTSSSRPTFSSIPSSSGRPSYSSRPSSSSKPSSSSIISSSSRPTSSRRPGSSSTISSSSRPSSSSKPSSSSEVTSSSNQNTLPNIDHSSVVPNGYKYVWGDEFEGTTLNKNLWSDSYTKMTGRDILIVKSTNKTISVKNGALNLTAYKDFLGRYHVPTSVHTQGTMNYKYGYVEMRAKLSLEVGSFASFWTRSIGDDPKSALASTNLNQFGEVDMFEVFQYNGKQYFGGNILKNSGIPELNWYATPMPWTQKHIVPDEDYHIYGYEWSPNEIKLYFDGSVYARFDMSKSWTGDSTEGMGLPGWNLDVSRFKDTTGTGMECFNDPQYLIFNHHLHIAVDDGNGGTTGFLASTSVTENKDFERADYVIDYVRLYQKDGQKLYTK